MKLNIKLNWEVSDLYIPLCESKFCVVHNIGIGHLAKPCANLLLYYLFTHFAHL